MVRFEKGESHSVLSVQQSFGGEKEWHLEGCAPLLVLLVSLIDFFTVRNNFLHLYAFSFAFELEA